MESQERAVDENTKLSDLTDRQILELTQGVEYHIPILGYEQKKNSPPIKDQESMSKPLVSELESIEKLQEEYESSQNDTAQKFVKKIRWLKSQKWDRFRRLRGDGNCFYRAFGYGLCERLIVPGENREGAKVTLEKFEALLPLLDQAGYEKTIYEDFWEPLRDILRSIGDGKMTRVEELLKSFNDQETCANIIIFLRLLTSAYLKHHENDFAPFLLSFEEDYERFPNGAPTLVEFCQFYVEAVDKDADHLAITALTRCLNVDLSIAYLDLSAGQFGHVQPTTSADSESLPVDFHRFETYDSGVTQDVWSNLGLLYRPGHYDLIYQRP